MKRRLTLFALALVACVSLSTTVWADGPTCGQTSFPGFVCTDAPPTSPPSLSLDDALVSLENILALLS